MKIRDLFKRLLPSLASSRQRRASMSVLFAVLCLSVLVGGVLLVAFWPRHQIYTLDMATEIVTLAITDPLASEWDLTGAAVYLDPFDEGAAVAALPEFSVLQLNPGVRVELQRHGAGPLRIKLEVPEGSAGRIDLATGEGQPLGPWAVLTVPLAQRPLVLPFRGHLTIGDDVAGRVDSILIEGRIRIVEEKLFTRGHYTAGEGVLDPGDRVQLWRRGGEEGRAPSRLDGFVRIEPQSDAAYSQPMRLVAHGQADYARIERFGSAGYEIGTQPWVRFVNDPVLGILFATLASLALLLEIFFKVFDLRRNLSRAKQKPGQDEGDENG